MSSRTDALQQMLEQDPRNAFMRYGLAMEFANQRRLTEAVNEFRKVIEVNPEYGAAYYHCGQALEKLGLIDEARAVYGDGIAVTARTRDDHTRGELQAALDLLP